MSPPPATHAPEERNLAVLAHAISFVGFVIPFGNIIGPLVVYLTQKDQHPWVGEHARESLNFQITITIGLLVSVGLMFVFVGACTLFAVILMQIIATIMATVQASKGEFYRYPLTLRLVS